MLYITDSKDIPKFQYDVMGAEYIGIDTETTGLNYQVDKLILFQVKTDTESYIFDIRKIGIPSLKSILLTINDSNCKCIFHNAKFDVEFLKYHTGVWVRNPIDIMLMEILIENGLTFNMDRMHSLKYLVGKYKNIVLDKETRDEFIGNYNVNITNDILIYATLDVEYLKDIYLEQLSKLEVQKQTKVAKLENRLILPVCDMEMTGIKLDVNKWTELMNNSYINAEEIKKKWKEEVFSRLDFSLCANLIGARERLGMPALKTKKDLKMATELVNPEFYKDALKEEFLLSSPKQVLHILNLMGFDIESTGEEVLEDLHSDDYVITGLLQYRTSMKMATSFGQQFIDAVSSVDGRIHPDIFQIGAQSGRFSIKNPAMQTISADPRYRESFIAEEGKLIVGADCSQEEYRLAGAVSKEPVIIKAYKDGLDMHIATAALVNEIPLEAVTKELRNNAKPVNFSILYGTSAYGMHMKQKISQDRAEWIISTFFKGYPVLSEFMKQAKEMIFEKKYSSTLLGRKRYFNMKIMFTSDNPNKEREKYKARIQREGFNHIIQGTGADIIKIALCSLFYNNPFGNRMHIILTVHDEIELEVDAEIAEQAKEFLVKCMEDAESKFFGDVPVRVDPYIDTCWKH
jgi:DNA polymerase I-like protein with 3'-5' exonuclease and polymerase domains